MFVRRDLLSDACPILYKRGIKTRYCDMEGTPVHEICLNCREDVCCFHRNEQERQELWRREFGENFKPTPIKCNKKEEILSRILFGCGAEKAKEIAAHRK